jgi:hypothetical protein
VTRETTPVQNACWRSPVEPSPGLRISGTAAQMRVVSRAGIRLDPPKSTRLFKGIICDDISEFDPFMGFASSAAPQLMPPDPGAAARRPGYVNTDRFRYFPASNSNRD